MKEVLEKTRSNHKTPHITRTHALIHLSTFGVQDNKGSAYFKQCRKACLLHFTPHFSHIAPSMYELHWLPLKLRIRFKILLFAFKAICGIAPTYIQNLVSLKSQGACNLR